MYANKIMTANPVVCFGHQTVSEVLNILHERNVRILPVVDENKRLLGVVNSISLLEKIVPAYILSDLKSISYAPDLGLLRKHYLQLHDQLVSEVMDSNPTVVRPNESLLSATAALITYDRHDYVLVVEADRTLVGVITANDVMNALQQLKSGDVFDA